MTLRALPPAGRWSLAARYILASLLCGASLLISANAHAARLGVSKNGSGTVTSSPAGINCGTTCDANYTNGTSVTLTASAASGYSFSGWSGACSGTSASCTVSIAGARRVTAIFGQNIVNYTLSVTTSGSGTVTSSPAGINCGTTCSASYTNGTNVTLSASAASGYSFSGWSGACSGTSTSCTVSMTAARSVTAAFSPTISNTPPLVECSGSGLAATDLSGQCRSSPSTAGALEAIGSGALPIRVTWSPYPGTVLGYIIYYGPTSTTAANLASDVPIGTANFDPAAPSVSYQPQDLGLSSGSAVCFQIFAYDISHALYNWSEVQCAVVQ